MSKLRTNQLEPIDSSVTINVADIVTTSDLGSAAVARYVLSVSDLDTLDTSGLVEGDIVRLASYIKGENIGSGGDLVWYPTVAKSTHNGITVFSPTVPFDDTRAALTNYRNALGETLPTGNGVFIRREAEEQAIYFNWSGGALDETSIDAQLQACIDIAQDNSQWVVMPRRQIFVLSSGVEWKHGDNGTDPLRYQVMFDGNNCIFRAADNTTSMRVVGRGAFETGDEVASLGMRRFILDGNSATTGHIGLELTALDGAHINGFGVNQIEDVLFEGYQSHIAYSLRSTRHIEFTRVVAQGPVRLLADTTSTFTGDLWWNECVFSFSGAVGVDDQGALLVEATANEIRGLHFTDCVTYGWGTYLIADGTGSVGDIWFTSCAWDGPGSSTGDIPIFLDQRNASAAIFGVHFLSPYIVGFNDRCVASAAVAAGGIRNVSFTDPQISGINVATSSSDPVIFQVLGVHGFLLSGGDFNNIVGNSLNGSAVATFQNGARFVRVVDNAVKNSGSASGLNNFVSYDNATVNGVIVSHNVVTSATTDIVAPFGTGSPSVLTDRNIRLT